LINTIIHFEHVSKRIGQREILRDLNLAINQGDIFGFLGPNGAGKTTTIRIALGLLHPTSGKVTVSGHDPEDGKTSQDRRRSTVRSSQIPVAQYDTDKITNHYSVN